MTRLPQGLVAPPGSSVANHTAGWRTERPRFLWEACTGCNLCVVYCPEGIVERVAPKRYAYDLDYCKGCGICAEECPVDDVVMEAELR
jgi:pyruvate ferredoxin oxidoreductase delta subunit